MFIIIDKATQRITQTISENYGLQVSDNEILQEIVDKSIISKITSAQDYDLIFDADIVTDIAVKKTWKEWQAEQPITEPEPTVEDYLIDIDFRLSSMELGL